MTRPIQQTRRDSSEPLLAAIASVMALMEETARIQKDTAQILWALSAQSGNETTVQTLARASTAPAPLPRGKPPSGQLRAGTGRRCTPNR